jgi:3-isopropylmalate/(R)-2-methylmalate dehydratase small subunit
MSALTILTGPAAPLLIDNVNTDMIAPMYRPAQAGILRGLAIKREDLAGMLFAGLRYDNQDREIAEFVLNQPAFRSARFLIGGANFGCGSSRDTAALMLNAFGIRCVIAPSFGEIFRDNCFKAGMLPLALGWPVVTALAEAAKGGGDFILDLAAQTLCGPSGTVTHFEVPAFRREQLLSGADEITLTLRRQPEILAHQERERAVRPWTFLPQRQIADAKTTLVENRSTNRQL